MVWPTRRAAELRRRRPTPVPTVLFLVNIVASSSDPRSAVVVAHVLAGAAGGLAARLLDGFRCGRERAAGGGRCHRRSRGGAAGADRQQEVAPREPGIVLFHARSPLQDGGLHARPAYEIMSNASRSSSRKARRRLPATG